ncbi:MAG TPA: helix-turn-helix domain-containing protein [Candidatus Limnocylindria bacterium]|jgi:CheY-like chemotaxis protein|nr:helix-turn-helix domain-containing protein [Candidatus Limnocylindria bacterium]
MNTSLHILIIDDNQGIHRDFELAFSNDPHNESLDELEQRVFGKPVEPRRAAVEYRIEHAQNGLEGIDQARTALAAGDPFQLAFVDIRMPGIDGVETISRIWRIDPAMQIVICTAYADYTLEKLGARLGRTDKLLYLKKPFDYIEVVQMANTLAEKWFLARQAALKLEQMELLVSQRTQKVLELQKQGLPPNRPDFDSLQHAYPFSTKIRDSLPLPPGASEDLGAAQEHPLILFVGQDSAACLPFVNVLGSGYRVIWATGIEQGLEQAREIVPDLVLIGAGVPFADGLELCRHLKRGELTNHAPVVLLEKGVSERQRADALEAGADYCLEQESAPSIVRGCLSQLLQQQSELLADLSDSSGFISRDAAMNQVDEQFLRRTTEMVEAHMADFEFDVDQLAQKMFVSRRQLLRKLKAATGRTPNAFIRTLRLQRAAQLLKSSGLTVREITFAVGFADLKHFRLVFREQYGISPAEYGRRSVREPVTD